VLIAKEFEDKVTGNTIFRLFFSLGTSSTLALSLLLGKQPLYTMILVLLVLQAVVSLVLPQLQYRHKSRENPLLDKEN
jgi:hypothetical protein